jgi:uncharacterized membrane protein YbaN (DUF454 family)
MLVTKVILVILGTLSLILGIIGIIVPGLPTTPFLLLTAGLYMKSSDRLHQWLISHKVLGSYILKFNEQKGMTKKAKIYSIFVMWIMISMSTIFFVDLLLIRLIILSLGLIGTLVMGFIVPTVKNKYHSQ